jgi:hemoglobin-like flavoprotein
MGLNVTLLRTSFATVVEREPDLTHRFYDRLFALHPEAEPLFHRRPRETQEKMLTGALVAALDHLEDAPWLAEQLGALGAKHVDYGITPEMYAWVGDALLATLADVAGPDWNDELGREWGALYGAISSRMLAGAAKAASAAG